MILCEEPSKMRQEREESGVKIHVLTHSPQRLGDKYQAAFLRKVSSHRKKKGKRSLLLSKTVWPHREGTGG